MFAVYGEIYNMAALSIRHMNITMDANEYLRERRMNEAMPRNTEPVYYWHIQRKTPYKSSRKRTVWKFVRDFTCTKAQIARVWCRYYRNATGDFRLRCLLKY